MVVVAQLVRALVCGTKGRGFEPRLPPKKKPPGFPGGFFYHNANSLKLISSNSFFTVCNLPSGLENKLCSFC